MLFVLLTSIAVLSKAQGVPEKSNAIIITMADSSGLNDKITNALQKAGYTVKKGKTADVLSTAPKTLKNNIYYWTVKLLLLSNFLDCVFRFLLTKNPLGLPSILA